MNPPLPSEISAFEPPSPSEFPVTFRGGGMDIFWNHTLCYTRAQICGFDTCSQHRSIHEKC